MKSSALKSNIRVRRAAAARGRAPRVVARIKAALLAVVLATLFAQIGGEAAPPGFPPPPGGDALAFYRSYLLTGDYVTNGINLVSKSAVGGFIKGDIVLGTTADNTVPANADIVAAYLYWETIWTNRNQLNGVTFRGTQITDMQPASPTDPTIVNKITGVKETEAPLSPATASCLASGGGSTIHLSMFRADVLHLLPKRLDKNGDWTGLRLVNDADLPVVGGVKQAHTVKLPDSGSGNGSPTSAGGSLVVIYRDTSKSLKKIVVYDGGYAQPPLVTTTQTIRGFLGSTGGTAKVTAIGGSGTDNPNDRFYFDNKRGTKTLLATNAFVGSGDRGWNQPTFTVGTMPGTAGTTYGEEVALSFDHSKTTPYDCQSFAAFAFSVPVADIDNDGIPDRLEDATSQLKSPPTPANPNGVALPRLDLMGASSGHKDFFVEINAMRTEGDTKYGTDGTDGRGPAAPYNSAAKADPLNPPPATESWCTPQGFDHEVLCQVTVPSHTHMPDPDGLYNLGYVYASHGITPHFDVGNTTTYLGASNACDGATPHAVCPYLVPTASARGGETILEQACDPSSANCQFPAFPGTVGWKYGLELFRDAPVGSGGEELTITSDADLQAWKNGANPRRRFDTTRRDLFHYVLYAHARGNPKSLPCLVNLEPAAYDKTMVNGKFTACNTDNTKYEAINYLVPSSASGIADQPGGNVLITLGLWDKIFGVATPFAQASTTLHELGHNIGLWHGGIPALLGKGKVQLAPTTQYPTGQIVDVLLPAAQIPTYIEPNCKDNYWSSMSYMHQVHGLIDANFEQRLGYSDTAFNTIHENALGDGKLTPAATYQPTWFAPANSVLALFLGVTSFDANNNLVGAATRLCNGPKVADLASSLSPPMARVWAPALSLLNTWDVAFDWNGNNVLDAGTVSSNANFDGVFLGSETLSADLLGSDDWARITADKGLAQTSAGKNMVLNSSGALWEGGGALWEGGGALWEGGGALWEGGGALWEGGGSLWEGGGALWEGGGALWEGGGALWEGGGALWEGGGALWEGGGPELDYETAKAMGRTPPSALKACVLGANPTTQQGCVGAWQDNGGGSHLAQPGPFQPPYHRNYLRWKAPSVGTPAGYLVYRVAGATVTPTSTSVLVCSDPNDPNVQRPDCPGATETTFVDEEELPNGLPFTYFVKARFDDDTQNQTSGKSNFATVNAVNDPAIAAADPPVAVPDDYSVNEEQTLIVPAVGVLANDSDPDSGTLGTAQVVTPPPGSATDTFALNGDGSFTFKPKTDFYGTVTFTYRIVSGTFSGPPPAPFSDPSLPATVTITVNPVNDAPSFTNAGGQTVLEDSHDPAAPAGSHTVPNWATNIKVAPLGSLAATNESNGLCSPLVAAVCQQTVDAFLVTNTNNALFSVQPAVAANGTLTYTLAADAFGTATVSVSAHDTGGTANGGSDTSAAQAFTITVTPVNDAPSFIKGADDTVAEDSGVRAVPWATAISAGPSNETTAGCTPATVCNQTVDFVIVSNDNSTLFSQQPAVAADGTLTYKPADNANGVAHLTVKIHDDGGTSDGGVNESATQSFTITVWEVNDPPVAQPDNATTPEGTAVDINVIANDSRGPANESTQTLTVDLITMPASHGTTQILTGPDAGKVRYTPAGDYNGPDAFNYEVCDNGTTNGSADPLCTTGTVTITVTEVNDPPVAQADSGVTRQDMSTDIDVLANDSPGPLNESSQLLTVDSITIVPLHGTATILTGSDAGKVRYTPTNSTYAGLDSFTYQVCDNGTTNGASDVKCSTAVVSITVTGRLAIVTNGQGTVSVIDLGTDTVTTTLTVGTLPVGASVTPDGNLGVVSEEASPGHLRLIDLAANPPVVLPSPINPITVTGVPNPESTAISPNGQFALVLGGQTNATTVDLQSGATVSAVPAGMTNEAGAITPDGTLALVVSWTTGNVAVFTMSSSTGALTDTGQRVSLGNTDPRVIAITPNGKLALVTDLGGLVRILSINGGTVVNEGSIGGLGTDTSGVAITPDGLKAYVSNAGSSDVAVLAINPTTNVVTDTGIRIPIPNGTPTTPFGVPGIAVTPDGTKVYVAGYSSGKISIIDTATDTLLPTTITVGSSPYGIGIAMPQQ